MNFDLPERVWRRRRRRGALLGLLLVIGLTQASLPATDNPIVVENQQPGSSAWMWSKMAGHDWGKRTADELSPQSYPVWMEQTSS